MFALLLQGKLSLPSIKLQVIILTSRCFNLIRPEKSSNPTKFTKHAKYRKIRKKSHQIHVSTT